MKIIFTEIKTAVLMLMGLAIITCGVYPMLTHLGAQALFPEQANGSLIQQHGATAGSKWIGQSFTGAHYFHPRPSGAGYDADQSGGSNLGPTSQELSDTIRARTEQYRSENGLGADVLIPGDAVTASASGLDPHISVKNAMLQAKRVAQARCLSESAVEEQVWAHIEGRDLGILGEERVNVLMLNMSLDNMKAQ